MPKKSSGSNSKRLTLRDKHKVIKKVKEHNRKKRKEDKKKGKKKPSLLKDPGIPGTFPYREQVVKELKFEQARILAAELEKKEARKSRRSANQNIQNNQISNGDEDMAVDMASELHSLRVAANEAELAHHHRAASGEEATHSGDCDGSRKWFYKEFKKVVALADVIMQVLDARDPLSCRCEDIERYIRSVGPNKKIIIVLNKVDLVPKEIAEQWLKYFRQELPTVAFKAATKRSGTIGHTRMPQLAAKAAAKGASAAAGIADTLLATSECLGADTLLQLLKNYTRNANIKTAITVGVVGMPNVGKSSLINSLKRTKVAAVGNMPGVTKSVQEINLDKQIRLLDSPGVVFSDTGSAAAAALRNCVKVEKIADPIAPVSAIVARVPAKRLMHIYRIAPFATTDDMLAQIAAARGKLRKGGTVDAAAAARIVLQDWNDGRIPFFTRPPARGNAEWEAAEVVVGGYAAEFDADAVFAAEASAVIAGLPSEADGAFVETVAGERARVDIQALEKETEAGAAAALQEADGDDSDMEDIRDDEPTKAAGTTAGKGGENSAAALFSEVGQVNPRAERAARKKAKKAKNRGAVVPAEAYDFTAWSDDDMAA